MLSRHVLETSFKPTSDLLQSAATIPKRGLPRDRFTFPADKVQTIMRSERAMEGRRPPRTFAQEELSFGLRKESASAKHPRRRDEFFQPVVGNQE